MKNNRPKCPSHQIKYVRPKYAYFVLSRNRAYVGWNKNKSFYEPTCTQQKKSK